MSNHTIQVDYEELTFDVNFDYFGPSKGAREKGSGVQLEPDEPADWNLCAVYMVHPEGKTLSGNAVKPVDVTDCLTNAAEDIFLNAISDHLYFESDEPDFDEDKDEPRFGLEDNTYI